MATYRVEMHGDVREVYDVEADSEEEARENWADGCFIISESQGMEIFTVDKIED